MASLRPLLKREDLNQWKWALGQGEQTGEGSIWALGWGWREDMRHMQSFSAWARGSEGLSHTGRMLAAFVHLCYKLSGPGLHHSVIWTCP